MSITTRKIKWVSTYLRPVPMPSIKCPMVKIYGQDELTTADLGIIHCNACAYAREIHINYIDQNGEVHCAAPK